MFFSRLLHQEVMSSQATRPSNGRLQFELLGKSQAVLLPTETGHLSQEVGPPPGQNTYYKTNHDKQRSSTVANFYFGDGVSLRLDLCPPQHPRSGCGTRCADQVLQDQLQVDSVFGAQTQCLPKMHHSSISWVCMCFCMSLNNYIFSLFEQHEGLKTLILFCNRVLYNDK